jgi:hypothetical protein
MNRARAALVGALLMVGLFVAAAPAGAQTNPNDYTTTCSPDGQTVSSTCTSTSVEATQVQAEPLARTGSTSSIPLARFAVALLAVGGLFVLMARRRRPAAAV